jgi:hypothetical protein
MVAMIKVLLAVIVLIAVVMIGGVHFRFNADSGEDRHEGDGFR